MKKIKKIIPFFVILISAIFFKTGNVFADDSIQVIPYPASVVSELLKQGSTKSLDFIYNDKSTYNYTNKALNFINNGTYKSYGKYYFYDHWGSDVPLVYVTDYPEVLTIIAYDEDDSNGTTGHFTYHINYDSSKPIYKYKPNSSSSVIKITTSEIQDGGHDWGFADSKLKDPYFIRSNFPEVRIIGGRTLQLDDVSYTNNEAVFIGSSDGSLSLNKYSDLTPKINSLEFKEDVKKKNNFIATNYELTIDNYNQDYNYYFAYASCMENNSCYNLTKLNTLNKYYDNFGKYNYQEDYLLNINGLIDENGKIDISLFANDTIIVLINDKDNNFVESKTFTITEVDEKRTNINENPYFTVENYTSDSCKIYENETEYKLCTSFKIYINDMANVHDYILYESINSADDFKEVGIWNNRTSITLYKNGDYAIYKLTDLEGNIIDTITVNAGGLKIFDENDTEVYLKHETNYNEDTKNAVVKYYFYNYKFNNYKIYYSEDGMCSEFNEITLNYENDIVGSIQKTYKENKTICFKITDLEGNYIKSFTYNLDYFSIMKNDEDYTTFDYMFNYLKEMASNSTKIFIHMTNVYNKIMSSNLGSYVMLVIFSCIIILILKALSR